VLGKRVRPEQVAEPNKRINEPTGNTHVAAKPVLIKPLPLSWTCTNGRYQSHVPNIQNYYRNLQSQVSRFPCVVNQIAGQAPISRP
jgi:hypothetical protein